MAVGVLGDWGEAFGQLLPSGPTLDPTTAGGSTPTACLKQPLPSECDADVRTMDPSTLAGCVDFCTRTEDRCLTTGGKLGCSLYRDPDLIRSTREARERRLEMERRLRMFPPPRRPPSKVIAEMKRDFGGAKRNWPVVDDRHCTPPQLRYGGECTPQRKAKVFIRKDIWEEAQVAVRHLMAFRPNETGGDWGRWSDRVLQWISIGMMASNINPRLMMVTQGEINTKRSEAWCNTAQQDSGDFPDGCPVPYPKNQMYPQSMESAFGDGVWDYPRPAYMRFQFEGINEALAFKHNLRTAHPGSLTFPQKIQDRLLTMVSSKTRSSLTRARAATDYWLNRRPYAAYETVFSRYPGNPAMVDGFGTTHKETADAWGEGKNVRVPGSGGYIRATEMWGEWFTSQDLDELVGRVTLFWISNHLLYFAERGELDIDPAALIEARDELLRDGFRGVAAIGAGLSEGLLGAIGSVIGAIAGVWVNLYLEIFNITFGTPRCPESLFMRVVVDCQTEEKLREQVRDTEAGGGGDDDGGGGDEGEFPFGLVLGMGGAAVAAGLLIRSLR